MEDSIKSRYRDLANRCYQNNQYTFTDFLSLADISAFYEIERELNFVKATMDGGNELSERKIIRFGSVDQLGYEEPFPIVCLEIKPLNAKFADDLNHRDFLGALMNLGIERQTIGDIFIIDNKAMLYCLESIAEYIIKNLSKVRHTSVMVRVFQDDFTVPEQSKEQIVIQVSSERVDAVIARVYKLSRDDSIELFREQKVFINGRLVTGNDTKVKENDRISVRGFGKFDISGRGGLSRKQKINLNIQIYK